VITERSMRMLPEWSLLTKKMALPCVLTSLCWIFTPQSVSVIVLPSL
jgi:hypothetical protein